MHKDLIRKELKDIQAKKEELRNNIETMKTKEEVEKDQSDILSSDLSPESSGTFL